MTTETPCAEPLRDLLRERDMTPEALAAEIDRHTNGFIRVTAAAVHNWIAGENRPRGGTQRAIAEIMGCAVGDLFRSIDRTPRNTEWRPKYSGGDLSWAIQPIPERFQRTSTTARSRCCSAWKTICAAASRVRC